MKHNFQIDVREKKQHVILFDLSLIHIYCAITMTRPPLGLTIS